MKTVFSGVQPTGNLTIGNYLGAFKNWRDLQDENRCIFCVVDLHSLTVRNNPEDLKNNSKNIIMLYMAAGIDPEKSIIYLQSNVSAHANLSWVLSCYTYIGELSRMTQFKEKSENSDNINNGLFSYPVLMAADILLYGTDFVPVGEDQKQHVELCREIAIRFNNIYGKTFTVPEILIQSKLATRIKGLQNPTKKMSKSSKDKNDTIFLLDTEKDIISKIKKAVTDSDTRIYFDKETKPGISNLLTMYATITNKSIEESEKDFSDKTYGQFKKDLIEVVLNEIIPLQNKFNELKNSIDYVNNIIENNAKKAIEIANKNLENVYKKVGLL
ncbi:MAG: tryptophan--tRNA ligase [Defluviitaleaceae bacterium]|nr:tryptophan--tRNA ligase [Defluviitaleaceae bacterium]